MIVAAAVVVAVVLLGQIPLLLHLDTRRSWAAEMETWHGADVEALPEPRVDLAFPEPVTPMDLPARWDTSAVADAAMDAPSRVRSYAGRHHIGVAIGRESQRAQWNSPTGHFWLIVAELGDLNEPCSHCAAPEDGERPHLGCPGCACPCGAVEPLPDGVEGYAIAGGTR